MRTLTRAGALCAVAAAALLAAPTAAHATAPGDNGTVKIHDATTGEKLRRNEPHVCTFYLDAFGFDAVQQVDWHIEAWAPTAATKGETVKTGAITLAADGHGRTEDLSLPDGHYKLFWNFDGEKGAAKHKVFWTDCKDSGRAALRRRFRPRPLLRPLPRPPPRPRPPRPGPPRPRARRPVRPRPPHPPRAVRATWPRRATVPPWVCSPVPRPRWSPRAVT